MGYEPHQLRHEVINFSRPGVPMERDTQPVYPMGRGRALYKRYNPNRIDIRPGDAVGCLLGALGNLEQEELASRLVELAQRCGEYVGIERPGEVAGQMLARGYLVAYPTRRVQRVAGHGRVLRVTVVAPTGKLLETIVNAQRGRERK